MFCCKYNIYDDDIMKYDQENTPWFSLSGKKLTCKCVQVYDGDSITLIMPIHGKVYKKKCRLIGIDTPELRTLNDTEKKAAIEAREFLSGMILNKKVNVECHDWDKYGRLLITVYINDLTTSINQFMIDNKHAYEYDGKTKKSFDDWFKVDL